MKKKNLMLILILPLLASCGGNNSKTIDPLPYEDPGAEVKEDSLYLGLKESKRYLPSTKVNFKVTVDDESLITYSKEDSSFISNTKSGTTTAHFVSDTLIYHVSIVVRDDGTAPIFTLDESSITINKDEEYLVNASLTYRNEDVFDESSGLNYTLESTSTPVSSLTINEEEITVKANGIGEDLYTIYTTYLGHTISNQLEVKVIENDAFVIIGTRLSFDNDGPVYEIAMGGYSENKINLKNDLVVSKNGKVIDYSLLTITSLDTSAVAIINNEIIPYKAGISYLEVKYNDEVKKIKVNVYKTVIESKDITLSDNRFDLNLAVTTKNNARIYTADKTNTKVIDLGSSSYSYIGVHGLYVDDEAKEISDSSLLTISNNKLTMSAALFGIKEAGEKEVIIELETSEYLVEYHFSVLFVTKSLSKKADYDDYCTMKFADEVVEGYYMLANDVDFYGYCSGQPWVSNAARDTIGFKGTIDGTKSVDAEGNVTDVYSFLNVKGSTYGMTITLGAGAVIKNVNFKNVNIVNKNRTALFASYILGARFENITIDFDTNSNLSTRGVDNDPNAVGIFSTQKVADSSFKNITINADNFDVRCLMGKMATNDTFDGCVVNCKSITYYYTGTLYNTDLEPTGGSKFKDNPVPGITINQK